MKKDAIVIRMKRMLPLSFDSIVLRETSHVAGSVLDLGCGRGALTARISVGHSLTVGFDIFLPYLRDYKLGRPENECVRGEARHHPFKKRSFDIVVALDIIEHIPRSDDHDLLTVLEDLARNKVVITTPNGFLPNAPIDENPTILHVSSYTVRDLEKRGYRVRGHGIKAIAFDARSLVHKIPRPLRLFVFALEFLLSPLSFVFPELGSRLIATKNLTTTDVQETKYALIA